jgi:hypothetical protein
VSADPGGDERRLSRQPFREAGFADQPQRQCGRGGVGGTGRQEAAGRLGSHSRSLTKARVPCFGTAVEAPVFVDNLGIPVVPSPPLVAYVVPRLHEWSRRRRGRRGRPPVLPTRPIAGRRQADRIQEDPATASAPVRGFLFPARRFRLGVGRRATT